MPISKEGMYISVAGVNDQLYIDASWQFARNIYPDDPMLCEKADGAASGNLGDQGIQWGR